MAQISRGTITITDTTDITDIYLQYCMVADSITANNIPENSWFILSTDTTVQNKYYYIFNNSDNKYHVVTSIGSENPQSLGWYEDKPYPTWQSGYQIWIREVRIKEGIDLPDYGTAYLDTAVNQINNRVSSTETSLTALQTKLKRIWTNLADSVAYPAGTYAASGITGTNFDESDSSTYGYNTFLNHNQLALRYNDVNMTSLSTGALTFYIPTQSNNQWVQGNKGLELSADGLKLYQFQNISTDNPNIAAVLDEDGLNITEGSITLGTASGGVYPFQVTSAGILTATGVDITGSIKATSFEAWANSHKRVEVTANGLLIYNNSDNLISQFGSYIMIGRESTDTYSIKVVSDSSGPGIYFRKNAIVYTSITDTSIRLGLASGFHTFIGEKTESGITTNGLTIYSGLENSSSNNVAFFGVENTIPLARLGPATGSQHVILSHNGFRLYGNKNSNDPIAILTQGEGTSGSEGSIIINGVNSSILSSPGIFYDSMPNVADSDFVLGSIPSRSFTLYISTGDQDPTGTIHLDSFTIDPSLAENNIVTVSNSNFTIKWHTDTSRIYITPKKTNYNHCIIKGGWLNSLVEISIYFSSSESVNTVKTGILTYTPVSGTTLKLTDNRLMGTTIASFTVGTAKTLTNVSYCGGVFTIAYDGNKTMTITMTTQITDDQASFLTDDTSFYGIYIRKVYGEVVTSATYNDAAFSFGFRTGDVGSFSTIIGEQLEASYNHQLAIGKYNNAIDAPFIIGNGLDANNTSNAFCIDWNGNIYPNGSEYPMYDFVIDSGYSSPWSYCRWNSGKMEMWGIASETSKPNTSDGGGYRTTGVTPGKFPISFSEVPVINVNIRCGSLILTPVCIANPTATSVGKWAGYRVNTNNSSATKTYMFYVVGKWK